MGHRAGLEIKKGHSFLYIALAGLTLRDPSASASRVQGLRCTPTNVAYKGKFKILSKAGMWLIGTALAWDLFQ